MKIRILSTALLASAALTLSASAFAHGGSYRGPGDTVPPGGGGGGGNGPGATGGTGGAPNSPFGGPFTPGAGGRGGPGMPGGASPLSPGGGDGGFDLTQWSFWWEFNKEPYLNLKSRIHDIGPITGDAGFYLGHGTKTQGRDRLRPSQEDIQSQIVPALRAALEKETNNDIVTGCLIALAKIGDAPSESAESALVPVFARFLADRNQEISETAAVALGILAHPGSIPTLEHLLADDVEGRRLVRQPEVSYRTRAFAAYGLGLVGSASAREEDRRRILASLRAALESDATKTRDLRVACVIALGLVPLETLAGELTPEGSRLGQLAYVEGLLSDERHNWLVRAHCPTTLARLLPDLPEEHRERVAERLLALLEPESKASAELLQSAVLALGRIGTNDDANPLDQRIRAALVALPKRVTDAQARVFALVALAQLGGTRAPRAMDSEGGSAAVARHLLGQLMDGKSGVRPWAGLACGIMGERLARAEDTAALLGSLQAGVRSELRAEKDPTQLGAYAIASGLMGDVEAKDVLLNRLVTAKDDTARGYVAIALGLMDAREATATIQSIVDNARYRPELLKQGAIALGLLGDKELVPKLVELLQESKGLATQASLSSALGFIGDRRSIAPLVQMLANEGLTERARAFAAVALGIVSDKQALPWNTKIGLDLNYRAATSTLTDQAMGTGILDIL